jgi:hypothetical protein
LPIRRFPRSPGATALFFVGSKPAGLFSRIELVGDTAGIAKKTGTAKPDQMERSTFASKAVGLGEIEATNEAAAHREGRFQAAWLTCA